MVPLVLLSLDICRVAPALPSFLRPTVLGSSYCCSARLSTSHSNLCLSMAGGNRLGMTRSDSKASGHKCLCSVPKGHPSVLGAGVGGKKSCRKRGGRELPTVTTLSGRAFREPSKCLEGSKSSKCLEGSKSLSILNKDQVLGSP